MRFPRRLDARRIVILVGVAAIGVGQLVSSLFQRYLDCQGRVHEFLAAESVYRGKAESLEEVAANLREVAKLAREMAGTSTNDFERSKWRQMSKKEDEQAERCVGEAVRSMARADQLATYAERYEKLAWRPWLGGPD